jgi:hypothetical protein
MAKFDFVDCLSRLPIGFLPIGWRGAFDGDSAGSGTCRRVLR